MFRRWGLVGLVASSIACSAASAEEGEAGSAIGSELPACASPLMQRIYEGAKGVIARGPIPEEVFATARNRVDPDVLIEGPEIFPKMAELIEHAESEILFQTFVWEGDSVAAKNIVDALGRLQERLRGEARTDRPPVVARFLVDASRFGIPSKKTSDIMPIVAEAIEAQKLDPSLVVWEIATFEHTTVGNNHGKTLVVDGREAVVTGANPERVHDPGEPWHDSGYHVTGDVALALMADFDYAWNRGVLWSCGSNRDGHDCQHDTRPIRHVPLASYLPEDTCKPILVIGRKRNANPFNNRTDNTQDRAFLAAFRGASSRIRIETPNLNDDAAKKALLDAIGRGVVVELIVGRKFNESAQNVPGQGGGNEENMRKLYEKLRERGVEKPCDMLRARYYSFDGVEAVVGNGPRASHTKYATIDGAVAIVGSTNMDTQSWNNAHEVDLVVDDAEVVRAWDQQLFEADFARAIPVDGCAEL
jgi:phosphatidylserine/phosphatidylglycerophosphate/cardiolipin synthase-like enzyme